MAVFWVCRRAIGPTWGLQPKVIYWIYTAMVRPILSYACVVWWPRTLAKTTKQLLQHLQRIACVSILGGMKTVPTMALEVMLCLPPLHMYLKYQAMLASYRLHCAGLWQDLSLVNSHARIWHCLSDVCPEATMVSDYIKTQWDFNIAWRYHFPSREDWGPDGLYMTSERDTWFTDGSRISDLSGAGVYCADPRYELSVSLGKYATVFQAEIYAILACCLINLGQDMHGRQINICSDSQAAIKALATPRCNSKLVAECKKQLNALGRHNTVQLLWVPGHCGILGNETVDRLAKIGSSSTPLTPEPVVGVPRCVVKRSLNTLGHSDLKRMWSNSVGMRQSKMMIRGPNTKLTNLLLSLNKRSCYLLTGFITGHCRLKRHLNLLDLAESPLCRLCEEEDETPVHLLSSCPALARLRWETFGSPTLPIEDLDSLPKNKILTFCESVSLFKE